jgi:pyruvate formate-lyase/glycerol dehydratase family glycyl radical enzyme
VARRLEVESSAKDLTERVGVLRDQMRVPPALCTERGRLITESYKQTEGEWPALRKAKALAAILDQVSISIGALELIVGNATSKLRGSAILPELAAQWLLEGANEISDRPFDRFAPVGEKEKAELRELLPYWQGKALSDMWWKRMPADKQGFLMNGVMGGTVMCVNGHYMGHLAVDFEKVLTKGLGGIREEIDQALDQLDPADPDDFEKRPFLEAARITMEAAARFAQRYAQLAEDMAAAEPDPVRKAELTEIAEVCRRVPEHPARTFYEALQSMCFVWIVLMLEGWGYGLSLGRADQYLYPFYERDLAAGTLNAEEAEALIGLLYIKANSTVTVTDSMAAAVFGGFPQTVNVILGGVTPQGDDAVNALSYLFLEADRKVGLSENDLVIRIHSKNPKEWVEKACEVAKTLKGKLKFMSDETCIQQLVDDGHPLEWARDYIITGCNSPSIPGRSFDLPGGMFNLPLMLELALNDGKARLSGQQIGPHTGNPRGFRSYDDVWNAYKEQVEALVPNAVLYRNSDRLLYAQQAPTPFTSTLFEGPIEKGRDIAAGGTSPYARCAISFSGAPDVGDALAAVKKAVFEDKKITIDQLVTALEKNFEGEEAVLHVLQGCPKFGNDDDYVDSIVNEVLMHGREQVVRHKGACGTKFNVAAAAVTANVALGMAVGALPDGRKAGEPLSEGGLSPHQGRNVSGPIASFRSVAKIENVKLTNGSVFNMRFSPGALKDALSISKLASMVRTFLETGGFFVQFNIVDTATLRAAQREPEKYRDLLVRVATYSSYFVELSPMLQEDVIRRMEFEEL